MIDPAYAHLLLPGTPLDMVTKVNGPAMSQLIHLMEACYDKGRADGTNFLIANLKSKYEISFQELERELLELFKTIN